MDPKVPRTKANLSFATMRFGVFMPLLTCRHDHCYVPHTSHTHVPYQYMKICHNGEVPCDAHLANHACLANLETSVRVHEHNKVGLALY